METCREIASDKDVLTPVQQGIKRGLKGLCADELANSSYIDALMKRSEQQGQAARSDRIVK